MMTIAVLHSIPQLISSIGTRYFYSSLACFIKFIPNIMDAKILLFPLTKKPQVLGVETISQIDKFYCESAYLLDPTFDKIDDSKDYQCFTINIEATINKKNQNYYNQFYRYINWKKETIFSIKIDEYNIICIAINSTDSYEDLSNYLLIIKEMIIKHESIIKKEYQSNNQCKNIYTKKTTHLESLTNREKQIVDLMLQGHSQSKIAEFCFISEGTVKNHKKNIYKKLNIHSQSEFFIKLNQFPSNIL
ncbi:regulatory LuxR family protein [Marinomonas alcarazii]|uniref:Regulatory LuxR family protein n=1 Tax=Marinomonas alcarazii TaxID=491949 RepID=A0A318V521_9GAMM|nr:helix-turn-helix transcriptional regulator [Marinomonas alcarazii]PYF83143.1 regulatory LuxR family protein [Marinomonas alcarazii]